MSKEVEQIKDRLDIVDLIGSYIKLNKAGRNHKARCPFHNEKTPSFVVSPERQSFYCFGCQAHGDIFSFVEKFEGLEFKEALEVLAERAGVELRQYRKEDKREESKKERILKALEEATCIYEKFLENTLEQRKYLDTREITEESIKKWRIGWVPLEWRIILNRLTEKGFKESELLEAGLVKKTEDRSKTYDVFRGRIMFPIFDISGRVIAFSGRIFIDDGKSAKYVNTPETEIFKKSDVLYGLNFAKSEIRRLDYSVLVEGQVDLVLSHQAGIKNTVASSGTALTESHLRKLQKLSSRCIIAYDSDSAGKVAARRSGELALSLGMEVKIASLSEGEDPASIIAKSSERWKEVLKLSSNLIEFAVDEAVRKYTKNTELIKEFNKSVIPLLSSVQSEMMRSEMVSLSSRKTKIQEKSIWSDLEKFQSKSRQTKISQDTYGTSSSIEPLNLSVEEMLAGIILWQDKSFSNNSTKYDEIRKRMEKLMGQEAVSEIVSNGRLDRDTLIFETEERFKDSDIQEVTKELLVRLEKSILEKKLFETARLLDSGSSGEEKGKLKKEAKEISKRIADLNK